MSYVRDCAFVLRREAIRERDRRYTLYGREHGLCVVIARGAASITSKQAGHLEPFASAEVMIAHGQAMDTLAVARDVTPIVQRGGLVMARFAVLGALCDTVLRLTRPGVSDEMIFHLLEDAREACASLSSEPTPERTRLLLAGATLKLLDRLGFAPSFETARDLPEHTTTLLSFLRRFPLRDVLQVTAPRDVFSAASSLIEDAVQHAPLDRPLHGPMTLHRLLT